MNAHIFAVITLYIPLVNLCLQCMFNRTEIVSFAFTLLLRTPNLSLKDT